MNPFKLEKENDELKQIIKKLQDELERCKKTLEDDLKLKDMMRKEQERILFYSGCK